MCKIGSSYTLILAILYVLGQQQVRQESPRASGRGKPGFTTKDAMGCPGDITSLLCIQVVDTSV